MALPCKIVSNNLLPMQDGVSISASDETSIDVGVLSFQTYSPATQQALTQYNVHSVSPSVLL